MSKAYCNICRYKGCDCLMDGPDVCANFKKSIITIMINIYEDIVKKRRKKKEC